MESDGRLVALAFAGTFTGGFAFTVACLSGDAYPALLALGMTAFCAAEFARVAAFTHIS